VGVWIAKGTKLRERRERDFVIQKPTKPRQLEIRPALGYHTLALAGAGGLAVLAWRVKETN